MKNDKTPYVCPAGLSGSLDNSIRRWFQNPKKILKPYINKGMTVLDLGCGPGFFTVDIAEILSDSGKVIAADLQEGMLEKVALKIRGTGLEHRVEMLKCQINSIGVTEKVDFVLAFWMVHEVPDHDRLFEELNSILKPEAKIFIVEPMIHVTARSFEEMSARIEKSGFEIVDRPKLLFSRAIILKHKK